MARRTWGVAILAAVLLAASPLGGSRAEADGWHEPPFDTSPLEYWKKNRERLGFGSGSEDGAPVIGNKPAEAKPQLDSAAAQKKHEELLKAAAAAKETSEKEALLEEAYKVAAELQEYELTEGGARPPDLRRRAFVHHCLTALAYTNEYNLSQAEFGWILQNRDRAFREIHEIFRQIGPEAAPQIWEHLRAELALGPEGKAGRHAGKQKVQELQKRIAEIRAKQAQAGSKELWNSLEEHIKPLQAEIEKLSKATTPDGSTSEMTAPVGGIRSADSLNFKKNQTDLFRGGLPFDSMGLVIGTDYVELLGKSLLAIGLPGLKHWIQGIWDPNPAVRDYARTLIAELGIDCVPMLADAMDEQPAPDRRFALVRTLTELTGKNLGDNAAAYRTWWEANRKGPINIPPPAIQPPMPPATPEETPLLIGPRDGK
ncbi:MAG: hypothetical protein HS116_05545 [Planctomycetes bacterium]|nr:hypothetical protein [Planctomycetota bacterium]